MAFKVVYTAEAFLNRQFDLADNHGTTCSVHNTEGGVIFDFEIPKAKSGE